MFIIRFTPILLDFLFYVLDKIYLELLFIFLKFILSKYFNYYLIINCYLALYLNLDYYFKR
jgi:hypothetical protein